MERLKELQLCVELLNMIYDNKSIESLIEKLHHKVQQIAVEANKEFLATTNINKPEQLIKK